MANAVGERNAAIGASLAEKDALIREIHHRIKNNLQIVTSLFNLHLSTLQDPAAREALADAQTRVNALAAIHRSLYEGADFDRVPLDSFLDQLVRHLSGAAPPTVSVKLSAEPLTLKGDRAVPLALLLTKLVTNAIRHGYPNNRVGTVQVTLAADAAQPGWAVLSVADDGAGMATDPPSGGTIGRILIAAFARQLGGKVTMAGREEGGTTVTIAFPLV